MEWTSGFLNTKVKLYCQSAPDTFGDLTLNGVEEPLDLTSQVEWCVRVLQHHEVLLRGFIQTRQRLEELWLKGEYESAIQTLDELEGAYGKSFWGIDVRIALLQDWKGLEAHKTFAAELQSQFPRSGVAYIVGHKGLFREVWALAMISILIVEDDASKLSSIRTVIEESRLGRVCVDVSDCVNHARDQLGSRKYDLVILDLAIPIVTNCQADPNGGVTLLEDIDKTDCLIRPSFIVGLTAFKELSDAFQEQFSSRLWSLEIYDPATGLWKIRLSAKIRYITGGTRQTYKSDACIVTALEAPELDSVMQWGAHWNRPESLDETTYVYSGKLPAGDTELEIRAACCSRKGMVAAALLTAKLILECRPRIVIMCGICAGVPQKSEIGDVLVADPCWNWQDGRLEPETTLFSPHQLDLAPELQARIRILARDLNLRVRATQTFGGVKPNRIPNIILGPLATGSAVIADGAILKGIARQHRDLIGADMEAYGVYAAALDTSWPKPLSVAMKSVCDFGNEEKDNRYQAFAAHMSGFVACAFLKRFGSEMRTL